MAARAVPLLGRAGNRVLPRRDLSGAADVERYDCDAKLKINDFSSLEEQQRQCRFDTPAARPTAEEGVYQCPGADLDARLAHATEGRDGPAEPGRGNRLPGDRAGPASPRTLAGLAPIAGTQLAGQQRFTLQVGVDGARALAAFTNRPDDQ